MDEFDRTASLMSPSKLIRAKPKSSASSAAWLDQMAADAGHLHVRQLGELRGQLEAQAALRDFSPLAHELTGLGETLPGLDFNLLKSRGWWARTTGKDRVAAASFAGEVKQIDSRLQELTGQIQTLKKKQQEQVSATERTLMEVDVEFHAIEKIIDQGTRWLQDMRTQLKTRQAEAVDEPSRQQVRDDAARCEILVDRLKTLRAVISSTQQCHQLAQDAAARRAALLQLLQQALLASVKEWRSRLSVFAGAAGDSNSPALNLDGPKEAHRELRLCVKQAKADCTQLQGQEKALADSLTAFTAQLGAVR